MCQTDNQCHGQIKKHHHFKYAQCQISAQPSSGIVRLVESAVKPPHRITKARNGVGQPRALALLSHEG